MAFFVYILYDYTVSYCGPVVHNTLQLPQHIWLILLCCVNFAVLWQLCCVVYYRATVRYSIQYVVACFLCIVLITLSVHSKWDISPSEGQNCPLQRALRNEGFQRVRLIDTSCPHDPLHWFFLRWWCLHVGTGWWCRRALQETVVWSPGLHHSTLQSSHSGG